MSQGQSESELVTIIYYCDSSLELKHQIITAQKNKSGSFVIPEEFKEDKSVIGKRLAIDT